MIPRNLGIADAVVAWMKRARERMIVVIRMIVFEGI